MEMFRRNLNLLILVYFLFARWKKCYISSPIRIQWKKYRHWQAKYRIRILGTKKLRIWIQPEKNPDLDSQNPGIRNLRPIFHQDDYEDFGDDDWTEAEEGGSGSSDPKLEQKSFKEFSDTITQTIKQFGGQV